MREDGSWGHGNLLDAFITSFLHFTPQEYALIVLVLKNAVKAQDLKTHECKQRKYLNTEELKSFIFFAAELF